jgi:hypothetical protein
MFEPCGWAFLAGCRRPTLLTIQAVVPLAWIHPRERTAPDEPKRADALRRN